MDRTPRVVDVRQIGPQSERDISGKCSACGAILFARLDDLEEASQERLKEKLEHVFAPHVTKEHAANRVAPLNA